MPKNKDFYRHTLSLCAAFTLGTASLTLPKQSPLELVIAALASLLFFLFLKFLFKKKEFGAIFYFVVFLISIIAGAACFAEYLIFLSERMLSGTSVFLIALLFGGCVIMLFLSKKDALYKFALAAFTFAAILRVAVGFFIIKNVSVKLVLKEAFSLSPSGVLSALAVFLPAGIALVYVNLTGENVSAATVGFSLSAVQLLTFAALSFGVLGSGCYIRPFSLIDAVSTANAGRIFTRTDGIMYVIFFVCALIKCAVCFKCSYFSFKKTKISFIKS